ncbi:MAG: 2'-5' RNA ligase family protein [Candidatus Shapirobacteria bacterium]
MKEYNSCYVGIPLPQKLNPEFGKLLSDVREIDSRLELTAFHPHITLLYLGGQFRSDLNRVYEETKPMLPLIRGQTLNIHGYGDFNGSTIFLQVPTPPSDLGIFHDQLIDQFGKGDNFPFHPHITVCKDSQNILVPETRRQLVLRLDEVDWSFPITRIMVRGSNLEIKNLIREDLCVRS